MHISCLIADVDYTATTVTVTFLSGTQSGANQTVDVRIIDDGIQESEEFVNIELFGLSESAEFAVISAGSGNGNITIISIDGKLHVVFTCMHLLLVTCNIGTLTCIQFRVLFLINSTVITIQCLAIQHCVLIRLHQ